MLLQCGVQVQPGASYAAQRNELRSWLQNHRLLIIFDDLRENALNDLADILPPKPCSALITSRIHDIAAIPTTFPLDVMDKAQAFELFSAVLGSEMVTTEKETLINLADRCKYNPLALEIAAHRILQMKGFATPAKLYLNKAEKRFEELYAAGDERWNMTAVFDLSYFDLNETDRSHFHQLAAFHNTGFAPNAAASIWGLEQTEANKIINRFINLSLLKIVPGAGERYRLHDLLDEYAALKLSQSGEEVQAGTAIAKWLVGLFDDHFTEDQTTAPEVLLEMDNLEKSAEWLISQKDGNRLADITSSARNWFVVLSLHNKWGQWSELALSFGIEDQRLNANVLQAIGDVQQFRDDREAALVSYTEALKLFKEIGARLGEANVYLSLGGSKRTNKDFVGARIDFQNAFNTYKLIGDQYSQARALYRLGDCLSDEEKFSEALGYYEQAVKLWHSIGVNDLVESILIPRIEEVRKHL
jgi:tetratricopeptide (TPR) repeat protein